MGVGDGEAARGGPGCGGPLTARTGAVAVKIGFGTEAETGSAGGNVASCTTTADSTDGSPGAGGVGVGGEGRVGAADEAAGGRTWWGNPGTVRAGSNGPPSNVTASRTG